jgi:flavodoxin
VNALVIYFSKFGNTQKVAEAIADELRTRGSARTLSADHLDAAQLKGVDLLVAGTPTHKMNLPETLRPLLDLLPHGILRRVPIAAFDTSYQMSAFLARFTAAKKLNRKLRKLGGRSLLPPQTFHVVGREGPLVEGELERARQWAGAILSELQAGGD